jgi:type I restriction enzyme, S subunit
VGNIPIIRIQNLNDSIPDYIYWNNDYDEKFVIKNGDYLLSLSGTIKIHKWKGVNSLLNQRIVKIEINKDVNDRYFFWTLSNQIQAIQKLGRNAVINNISLVDLKSVYIPLPPIDQQIRIAKILDTADAMCQKDKELLAAYDELLQAIFLDMFGIYLSSKNNILPLSDVSEVVSGVTKGKDYSGKTTINLPYMRVYNVQDGHIVLDEIKTIDVLASDLEKYRLLPGDILLTEGGDPDKLGRGAVWKGEIENCIHQNHIFRVRITHKEFNEEYLSSLISSAYGKKYFLKAAKQTTGIASINSTQLKNFPVITAPYALQIKYKRIIESIGTQKALVKQNLQQSEEMFNALVQKAFKGEL